jgi:hypothetical protein
MVHVLNVSMPRSGHHLLEMILKNTLRDAFSYCEFYEKGCCKAIPCTSAAKMATRDSGIFMQKSHDFEFGDPLRVPGTYRVVQYRSPVPRALSNYELHLKTGHPDTVRNFRDFLVMEALYSERFYKKWIANRTAGFFLLGYEELTSDPLKATLEFFTYVGFPVDADRVAEGVAQAVGMRGRDLTAFMYHNVYEHRYAKLPIVANFEDLVNRSCPGYYPVRYFSAKDSASSLIGLLVAAKRAIDAGDRATALACAEAARQQDPEDLALKRILSQAQAIGATGAAAPAGAGADANSVAPPAPGLALPSK